MIAFAALRQIAGVTMSGGDYAIVRRSRNSMPRDEVRAHSFFHRKPQAA
jgi:hypothetical protein